MEEAFRALAAAAAQQTALLQKLADRGEKEKAEDGAWDALETETEKAEGQGEQVARALRTVPPKDVTDFIEKNATRFQGLPRTPRATRQALDKALHGVQQKVELQMHLLVQLAHVEDQGERDVAFQQLSATTRTIFQQLQDIRRQQFVRRARGILDEQAEDNLLTKEENQRMQKQPQARWQSATRWPFLSSGPAWRAQSAAQRARGRGRFQRGGRFARAIT